MLKRIPFGVLLFALSLTCKISGAADLTYDCTPESNHGAIGKFQVQVSSDKATIIREERDNLIQTFSLGKKKAKYKKLKTFQRFNLVPLNGEADSDEIFLSNEILKGNPEGTIYLGRSIEEVFSISKLNCNLALAE